MRYKHRILSLLYYPYKIISNKKNNLRVLLFHDIAKDDFNKFKNILEWLSKDWNFISADDFGKMMNGDKKIIGNNLLLTFDDVFLSDYFVVKEILNPMGIPALFFIISEFCMIDNKNEQKIFLENNLYPE